MMTNSGFREESWRFRVVASGEIHNLEIQFGGLSIMGFHFDKLQLGWWSKKRVVTTWNSGNTSEFASTQTKTKEACAEIRPAITELILLRHLGS
jgi:hypothetical protein